MKYFNLKEPTQKVGFSDAIQLGLGNQQGLFMPAKIPELFERHVKKLLDQDFVTRSIEILAPFVEPDIDHATLTDIVSDAFNFPVKVPRVNEDIGQNVLELFHGPSLAFKDFGARFLARCMGHVLGDNKTTVLTATSGDTGAAVAHAFLGVENVRVVILYPKGKISPLQEKLFCTMGHNIETIAVDGDFDACQAMVKLAFSDDELRSQLSISSANSINVARLLAQICYYFEIFVQQPDCRHVCVPSGNFGNLTAGLIAKAMGLPIQRMLAATNINDTVPRFFATHKWEPHPTVATISNAMDVAQPNNFPRVTYLANKYKFKVNKDIFSIAVSDEQTREMLRKTASNGYIADPHTALGMYASQKWHNTTVLGTAHPAKFIEVLQTEDIQIELPEALAKVQDAVVLSEEISDDYSSFREILLED
jgi:threonine synthase